MYSVIITEQCGPEDGAEFDKLARMVQRQNNVAEPVPPFYLRTLTTLDTSVSTALAKEKEAKKKMNATNARALNSMKQKVKKAIKEYEKDIKEYQEVRMDSVLYCPPNSLSGPRRV